MLLRLFLTLFFLFSLYSCSDSRSEHDRFVDKITVEAANKVETSDFYAIGIGGGCSNEKKINLVKITFFHEKKLTIDIARRLIVKATEELANTINSNPNSPNFFEQIPFPITGIETGVISRTKPKTSDEIGGVMLLKGHVFYYIDNPSTEIPHPPLWDVHEESYEKAKAIVEKERVDI